MTTLRSAPARGQTTLARNHGVRARSAGPAQEFGEPRPATSQTSDDGKRAPPISSARSPPKRASSADGKQSSATTTGPQQQGAVLRHSRTTPTTLDSLGPPQQGGMLRHSRTTPTTLDSHCRTPSLTSRRFIRRSTVAAPPPAASQLSRAAASAAATEMQTIGSQSPSRRVGGITSNDSGPQVSAYLEALLRDREVLTGHPSSELPVADDTASAGQPSPSERARPAFGSSAVRLKAAQGSAGNSPVAASPRQNAIVALGGVQTSSAAAESTSRLVARPADRFTVEDLDDLEKFRAKAARIEVAKQRRLKEAEAQQRCEEQRRRAAAKNERARVDREAVRESRRATLDELVALEVAMQS